MVKVIEVFVKNRKVLTESSCYVRAESGHPCAGATPGITYETESVLPEAERQALDTVKAIANEKGFDVKVYNLSTTMGKLRARLKSVEKTPTVIIDDKRIDGIIKKDAILNALE